MLVRRSAIPSIKNKFTMQYPFIHLAREGIARVTCLVQKLNTLSPATAGTQAGYNCYKHLKKEVKRRTGDKIKNNDKINTTDS